MIFKVIYSALGGLLISYAIDAPGYMGVVYYFLILNYTLLLEKNK